MRPARSFVLLLSLLFVVGVTFAPGVQADEEETPGVEELGGRVVLNVGDEPIELEAFLRVISKATGVPLIWNPADKNIRGKKIVGQVDWNAPIEDLFSQARALLTFYELVIIPVGPQGNQLHLVMDARQTSSILKLKPEHVVLTDENIARYEHQDGFFLTTTIHVEHMDDLRAARNALVRIVTGQNIGNVTEVPHAKAFVVTDFAPNVVAIYRLLREMDKPAMDASTTSGETVAIDLEHAVAQDLARVLNQHFMQAPMHQGRAPQTANAPSAPRITPDARTNRLLVTGTPAEVAAVKAAIAMLDTPVDAPETTPVDTPARPEVLTQVIVLKHASAQHVMMALANLGSPPGLWSTPTRPSFVAHEGSLIVAATKKDMAIVEKLVDSLDQP